MAKKSGMSDKGKKKHWIDEMTKSSSKGMTMGACKGKKMPAMKKPKGDK